MIERPEHGLPETAMPETGRRNHVEITGTCGPDAKITVDGNVLYCPRAVMTWDAQSLPVLEVALPVSDGFVVTLDGRLGLAEETRAALTAMGWTPPPAPAVPPGTWLDDCRTDLTNGAPCFARSVHLPTGTWAEATGLTRGGARRGAERELGGKLVASGRLTVNDVNRALGLSPWPQDAKADEPAADLASEARPL